MELTESERRITERRWLELVSKLNKQFDADLDMQGVLFLIGLQETGLGYRKYEKDEKLNILHVATCVLLEPYGFYEIEGHDSDGWPHFKIKEELPFLKPGEQVYLMKNAILDYFKEA
ncbi:MAG: hypothetical protein IT239_02400 [Bacteroidia bacterium]|nr:hypothetical protein [Bacteroidia bacterium]